MVASSVVIFVSNFTKICQLVLKLLREKKVYGWKTYEILLYF